MITGPQLQSALLSRQISAKDLALKIGVTETSIHKWLKKGVPEAREAIITTTFLNDMEAQKWGAQHIDMFPDTLPKDAL